MQQQTMLIVTARVLDAVKGCGGVIAKYAKEGHRIELIVLSDLDREWQSPQYPKTLNDLGVTSVTFAGLSALPLEPDDQACEWLACKIREIRPDFIITHAKEPDLRTPDRGYASAAVMKAYTIASAAGAYCNGLPVAPRQTPMFGIEPDYPEEIGWVPGLLIDITAFEQQKNAVLDQLCAERPDERLRSTERAKNRAVHCSGRGGVTGCKLAEAFSCFGPIYAHGYFVW